MTARSLSRLHILATGVLTASLVGSVVAAVPESAPFTLPTWSAGLNLPDVPPPPRALQPAPRVPKADLSLMPASIRPGAGHPVAVPRPCPAVTPAKPMHLTRSGTPSATQASSSVAGGISTAS